jgi:hypothetical protein
MPAGASRFNGSHLQIVVATNISLTHPIGRRGRGE